MASGLLFSFQSLTESDELECDELDTLPLDEPDELDKFQLPAIGNCAN